MNKDALNAWVCLAELDAYISGMVDNGTKCEDGGMLIDDSCIDAIRDMLRDAMKSVGVMTGLDDDEKDEEDKHEWCETYTGTLELVDHDTLDRILGETMTKVDTSEGESIKAVAHDVCLDVHRKPLGMGHSASLMDET